VHRFPSLFIYNVYMSSTQLQLAKF
jgi:hypothetical protein